MTVGSREVVIDTFPMGIDYDKFETAAQSHLQQGDDEKSDLKTPIGST